MVKKQVTGYRVQGARLSLLSFLVLLGPFPCFQSCAVAQQPQAQAGQPIYGVNAKYVQGVGPGYWPTAGSGLTLSLAAGTAYCGSPPIPATYSGGTLTMAAAATNYVYLDPTASCAPAANTTGFVAGQIPIAKVVTSSTTITSATDARVWFVPQPVNTNSTGGAIGSMEKLNDIRFANNFPGSDLGAQINAADADLGSNPGEIWVSTNGTITTPVSVCANGNNHALRIMAGVTVTEAASAFSPTVPALWISPGSIGCSVRGEGVTSVILNQATSYNGGVFGYDGIQVGRYDGVNLWGATVNTRLAADLTAVSATVQVTSSTGFTVGMDLMIKESGTGPSRWAEFNIVSSVPDGTHITLKYPTEHIYRATLNGNQTFVVGFGAGTLTKNWAVQNLRVTSTTTAKSSTGSGSGVNSYVATDGYIRNVWVDNVGSRGIAISASGEPAARVIVQDCHIRNAGLVPTTGGSPSMEAYSQGSHVTFSHNEVWDAGSVGISMEAQFGVLDGNQVWFTGQGGVTNAACFSFSGPENVSVTGNLAAGCAGYGFWFQGSATDNTVEGKYFTVTGNTSQDTGLDGFSFGSSGTGGYVRAQVMGNFAYRARGTHGGFVFWVQTPNTAINAVGNWSEGNANAGFFFGNTAIGGILSLNTSKNNLVGFSLNSPSNLTFMGNQSDGDATGVAFGTAVSSIFTGNKILNAATRVTGTVGSGSYATSNIGFGNFGATGPGNVGPNQNYGAVTLSPSAVPANTCAEQTFSVAITLATTDIVFVIKPSAQAGLGIAGARVSSASTIGINFCNNTGASIRPTGGESYIIGVLR